MAEEKVIYFAHPVNVYNTSLEAELLQFIQLSFPDWRIENPNQQKHQEGYKRAGMEYYKQEVLPNMNGVTGLHFPDGRIGAGVFCEEESIFARTGNLWTLTWDKVLTRMSSVEGLRSLALTPEETRPRIYVGGKRENGMKDFFAPLQ